MINEYGLKQIKFNDNNYDDDFDNTRAKKQRVYFYHNYFRLTPYLNYIVCNDTVFIINKLMEKYHHIWDFKNVLEYGTLRVTDKAKHYEHLINLIISYTGYLIDINYASDWVNISNATNVDNIIAITMHNIKSVIKHDHNILNSYDDLDDTVNYENNIKQNQRLYKIFRRAVRNYNRHGEVHFTKAMQKRYDKKLSQKKN